MTPTELALHAHLDDACTRSRLAYHRSLYPRHQDPVVDGVVRGHVAAFGTSEAGSRAISRLGCFASRCVVQLVSAAVKGKRFGRNPDLIQRMRTYAIDAAGDQAQRVTAVAAMLESIEVEQKRWFHSLALAEVIASSPQVYLVDQRIRRALQGVVERYGAPTSKEDAAHSMHAVLQIHFALLLARGDSALQRRIILQRWQDSPEHAASFLGARPELARAMLPQLRRLCARTARSEPEGAWREEAYLVAAAMVAGEPSIAEPIRRRIMREDPEGIHQLAWAEAIGGRPERVRDMLATWDPRSWSADIPVFEVSPKLRRALIAATLAPNRLSMLARHHSNGSSKPTPDAIRRCLDQVHALIHPPFRRHVGDVLGKRLGDLLSPRLPATVRHFALAMCAEPNAPWRPQAEQLAGLVTDADPLVRALAVGLVRRHGEAARPALTAALTALERAPPFAYAALADALAAIGLDRSARNELRRRVRDASLTIAARSGCAWALARDECGSRSTARCGALAAQEEGDGLRPASTRALWLGLEVSGYNAKALTQIALDRGLGCRERWTALHLLERVAPTEPETRALVVELIQEELPNFRSGSFAVWGAAARLIVRHPTHYSPRMVAHLAGASPSPPKGTWRSAQR